MREPKNTYLSDYRPPSHHITHCELVFDIFDEKTIVSNTMKILALDKENRSLLLNGKGLELLSLKCNGIEIDTESYLQNDTGLKLLNLPADPCTISVVTAIYPKQNTNLEGLYVSGDIYCTQNEPEGFRRISYFLDRPDNMTVFTTTVIADRERFPILLSNGNMIEKGSVGDARHFVKWHDPFVKPSYLFALVAGDLDVFSDSFVTSSRRSVDLNIYVDKGNRHRCSYAMRSLKAAMKWDEKEYGREYDLDVYNIVAVDSFNMGAMENKGLNIFNSHYVLADEEHATDQDFMGIESVIAHEYFHNWTGNRITCRDWFQLTLKEGLTVFRDQCFSADMNSPVVQRIKDVKMLQQRQFAEDAGPTAHPVKPDHYIEINNFYTATVYEKGAEVIRMLHTFLGPEKFRRGMDRYFILFDGQAVRTEDFIFALTQDCRIDIEQFKLWYTQERTPVLYVDEKYDAENREYTLYLTQIIPKSVEGKEQKPYLYPLGFALLDEEGRELDFLLDDNSQIKHKEGILIVSKEQESILFKNVAVHPKLSINRGFSAPVKVVFKKAAYGFLMSHDSDGFNRYEAAQTLALQNMIGMAEGKEEDGRFTEAFGEVLNDKEIDLMSKALILELPGIDMLMQEQKPAEIESLAGAHERLMKILAAGYEDEMLKMYRQLNSMNSSIDAESMAQRAMKNCLLAYLAELESSYAEELCVRQYYKAGTMTDRVFALRMLEDHYGDAAEEALKDFYGKYSSYTLVMNKYLSIVASSKRNGVLERVKKLQSDAVFDIKVPNLVRSLIGSFARNLKHFHDKSGDGYVFVADKIIELDTVNPQMASSIAGAYKSYDRLGVYNKKLIKKELERILESDGISKNVYEIVEKILTAENRHDL